MAKPDEPQPEERPGLPAVAAADERTQDVPQPLLAHLTELRSRLLRMLAVVLAAFLGLIYFANDLYAYISAPLRALLPEGATMIATEVASPFLTPVKLTIIAAALVSVPYLLYQTWAFVSPGLYRRERRFAVPLLLSSIVLFYAGVAFAYFVVLPLAFGFFTAVAPEGVQVMTDINHYLNFVLKLLFAFGIAFEIPIATVLLIRTGLVSARSLSAKRPYVVVGCFVIGMLLTPPDIISQTLLAVPVWLLFEIGILFGRWVEPSDARQERESEDSEKDPEKDPAANRP